MTREKTVLIIASGPSLERADIDVLRARADAIVAINDNYLVAPMADVVYASDYGWWKHHSERVRQTAPKALLATRDPEAAEHFGLILFPYEADKHGLSDTGAIRGACSGEHAIHLVEFLYRPARMLLTGYDMGATGQGHWFGEHPQGLVNGCDFATMLRSFPALACDFTLRDCDVVNYTRATALTCFRRATVESLQEAA